MLELPKIQANQYYLIFAESATGILVDQDDAWHIEKPNQMMYTIVNSYKEAESIVRARVVKNPSLEGSIYNFKHDFINMFYVLGDVVHNKLG